MLVVYSPRSHRSFMQQLENSLSGSFQLVAIACGHPVLGDRLLTDLPFDPPQQQASLLETPCKIKGAGGLHDELKTICHRKLWNCVWPTNNDGSAKKSSHAPKPFMLCSRDVIVSVPAGRSFAVDIVTSFGVARTRADRLSRLVDLLQRASSVRNSAATLAGTALSG